MIDLCFFQIEETVYEAILESESFEKIIGTTYQKNFVTYCLQRRTIDTLLVFAIKQKRWVLASF